VKRPGNQETPPPTEARGGAARSGLRWMGPAFCPRPGAQGSPMTLRMRETPTIHARTRERSAVLTWQRRLILAARLMSERSMLGRV
jgi:hypothetical protein